MMLKSAVAVTLFAATAVLAQSRPQINTPGALTECQPVLLTWSGGQGPYFVSVIPGGQPGAAALVDFGSQSGNQLTWKVNLPAGTNISLKIVDQTGNTNYAQAVNIQKGSDESCVGKPIDNAAASGGSTPSAAAGGAASGAASGAAGGASGSAAAPTTAAGASPSAAAGGASPSAGGASPSAAKPSTAAGGASSGAAAPSGSASHAAGSSGAAAPSASASKPSSANKIIASTGLVALLGAVALLF
ncbi:uncharacterized protein LOC62_03G004825 [Vanrija pseudolonga]|uniref:Uncharacterized protein n=1 Tax=Vanrija pseudolonga TaxID=143232 RepID=A0AAF1BI95_9TREE|nr:hypothetical protein LOC62_03G004825 [Vanrija pseudolonga]